LEDCQGGNLNYNGVLVRSVQAAGGV